MTLLKDAWRLNSVLVPSLSALKDKICKVFVFLDYNLPHCCASIYLRADYHENILGKRASENNSLKMIVIR